MAPPGLSVPLARLVPGSSRSRIPITICLLDSRQIKELVAAEDMAVSDLLNACDDYCEAIAGAEPERAEDAQRARNRAKTRLSTVHERLAKAITELAD